MKQKLLRASVWILPTLVFLYLYKDGLRSWFQQDDFAWLQQWLEFNSWRDLPTLLFAPKAQGTIRPLSERLFFLAGYGLFGLDPRPMHALVALTQFGSILLLTRLALRLTGSHLAALLAPILWLINPGLATPLSWLSAYNQVLCGFFLLASLSLYMEAVERGGWKWWVCLYCTFIAGFGALEVQIVFPALALVWALLYRPTAWARTLPLWAISAFYFVLHHAVAAKPSEGVYAAHWDLSIVPTFARYVGTALTGGMTFHTIRLPAWSWEPAAWAAAAILLAGAAYAWRCGWKAAAFGMAWFIISIAPVLPLRDHFTTYYLAIPTAGVALAAAALIAAPKRALVASGLATALVLLVFALPLTKASTAWHRARGNRLKTLVEGIERANELHPGKLILLEGLDNELFWGGFFDGPHRLLGIHSVMLVPGSETKIDAHPELGDLGELVCPPAVAARSLADRRAVVYRFSEKALENITRAFRKQIPEEWSTGRSRMIDAGEESFAEDLGPGWYEAESGHRWMGKQASVTLSRPGPEDKLLRLNGFVPAAALKSGPVLVRVGGKNGSFGEAELRPGQESFNIGFRLPEAVRNEPENEITITVSKTYRALGDPRELGLAFGRIGWASQ